MIQAIIHWLRALSGGLTYLVYPNVCWVCGRFLPPDSPLVCVPCAMLLVKDPHPTCPRCSTSVGPFTASEEGCVHCRNTPLPFERALRLGPYEGLLREVILRMKRPDGEGLAEAVAMLSAKQMAARLQPFRPTMVIPVPLHWSRRFMRGYNQSETLGRHLAKNLQISCRPSWLRRRRRTPYQTDQPSPAARKANVQGAFTLRPGVNLRDQVIVLVDDVMTSGATISEAARALRLASPAEIVVAVLAHGH